MKAGQNNRNQRDEQMDELKIAAYAKINLSLDVLGRLPGGYHEMKMVMQTVSLCDDVLLAPAEDGLRRLETNFGFLPSDGRNIARRAAEAFFAAAGGGARGLSIRLEKRIPVGAGLGGGSADAAAVLRGLNGLSGQPLPCGRMLEIAAGLGSDVPFCLLGGTRLASGRGEVLEELPSLPDCGVVICKPGFSIRTPDLFAKIDSRHSRIRPDTDGLVRAIRDGDLNGVARRMYNVFEDVLPQGSGEVGVIKQKLLSTGALGAVMSGTGSAVFGLFPDRAGAEAAAAALREDYRDCFAAVPVGNLL